MKNQIKAIEKFGMEVQLQHAIEELTELSLETQKVLRDGREYDFIEPSYNLACEFCDARNALKTIEIFLSERYSTEKLERIQKRKDAKFERLIDG